MSPAADPRPPRGLPRFLGAAGVALLVAAAAVAVLERAPTVSNRAAEPFVPDDPGWTSEPGGWADLQWNFAGPNGVDAPTAWGNLAAAGASGGAGVTVAVLDTGVAYPTGDPSRPGSPDLAARQFVAGYDFVDDDPIPYDPNGHGTHVASTIAELTNNGLGLTGLAYGVSVMPVRVLDRTETGEASTIARGVQYAVEHGAQVINLSLNFAHDPSPEALAGLAGALEEAHDRGTLVVVGAGNAAQDSLAYPASVPHVLAVGATTESGCLANYSNYGQGLDLVAPGGGGDAHVADDPHCRPGRTGAPIYQVTRAVLPELGFDTVGYTGTSMATPHVTATAALVIASGVLGPHPSPDEVQDRLEQTARDLGASGYDSLYGWGLVNAAAATASGPATRP
jgi:serine protease